MEIDTQSRACIGFQIIISLSFLCLSIFCFVMTIVILVLRHFVAAGAFGFLSAVFAAIGTLLYLDARSTMFKLQRQELDYLRTQRARAPADHMDHLARLAIEREIRAANVHLDNNRDPASDSGIAAGSTGSENSD